MFNVSDQHDLISLDVERWLVRERIGLGAPCVHLLTTHPALRQCRALDILDCTELPRQPVSRFWLDGSLLLFAELLDDCLVVAQVDLGPDNEAGDTRAVVVDLWEPLLLHVLKRCGGRDAEADEEDVGLRVRQGPQPVVVLLSGRVEEAERVRVVPNHDGDGIVVKDGGDVLGRELVGGVSVRECGCRVRDELSAHRHVRKPAVSGPRFSRRMTTYEMSRHVCHAVAGTSEPSQPFVLGDVA